ncbi:hypothetical protein CANCADRAFT_147655 [Tortispora caseinolytica NRRL Y-17796]|uniref:Peroxisomal leader peptide-processing protease n=1 Tax=Tortispora caseinolytica NRRL Y-17796 TaxID=767744 RepID=A0A1E4TLP0_9ASCO|nr:hypothetical protein CANCADRAFT_147655 [Tortispora caseinolytica NRRL Y-17796]
MNMSKSEGWNVQTDRENLNKVWQFENLISRASHSLNTDACFSRRQNRSEKEKRRKLENNAKIQKADALYKLWRLMKISSGYSEVPRWALHLAATEQCSLSSPATSAAKKAMKYQPCCIIVQFIITWKSFFKNALDESRRLLPGFEIAALHANNISEDMTEWVPLEIHSIVAMNPLPLWFQKLLSMGFKLHPEEDMNLVVLLPLAPFNATPRPFRTAEVRAGDLLHIHGAPFAAANSALFTGYQGRAYVSYSGDLIFSDFDFLYGLQGGVATTPDHACVGLVLGSLSKGTDVGRVTVIVPWKLVTRVLRSTLDISDNDAELMVTDLPYIPMKSVPCVRVVYGQRASWGSAVLLDSRTLVTSRHVVGIGYTSITALFPQEDAKDPQKIPCTVIGSPIENLDIIFLRLTVEVLAAPVEFELFPHTAQRSVSVGYGLFPPTATPTPMNPLLSFGEVSKVFRMKVLPNSRRAIPAMIMTSSACYSGASGGGLFTTSGKLLGIITSNGKVTATSEVFPHLGFVIPSSLVKMAWTSLHHVASPLRTTSRLKSLWDLEPTHKPLRPKL